MTRAQATEIGPGTLGVAEPLPASRILPGAALPSASRRPAGSLAPR